jgi:Fe-S-cluster containining protein
MRPCAACIGECCRHYFVSLNGHDVRRIAAASGLAPTEFVVLGQEATATPAGFRLDATRTTFALVLEKHQSFDGRQACVFLDIGPNGAGRCRIYEARPAACRAFPARLLGDSVTFRDDIVCPQDSWASPVPNPDEWRKILLRSRMEWAVFAAVVARWNERATATPRGEMRTPQEFYDFLFARYERIAALESQFARDMDEIVERWGQRSDEGDRSLWERFASAVDTIAA